ncbi:MAG: DUF1376 domain-containing protein [Bradyrhizobium sp.]|nr:DUF1376 domain-containing protein [Bradyrhizobium sp.]
MPLDITRLFGSGFHAKSDDSTWRAGITLWLKSYHQVPAASLPDDDIELARLAEFGRDMKSWRKIKSGALRGWVKCSDGRLYHKVVAEKALEAWIDKVAQRKVSAAGNAKRYNQEFDPTPFDLDIEKARVQLAVLNPQSRMLARKGGKYAPGSPSGSPAGNAVGVPREEKRREVKESKSLNKDKYLSPGGGATDEALELFFKAYPSDSEHDGVRRELGRRLGQGVPLDAIVAGARRYALKCSDRSPAHIASPVKWLVDGRWKDDLKQQGGEGSLPIIHQGSPQGDAWDAYKRKTTGKPMFFQNGRATVHTEWPPDQQPGDREHAA